MAEKSRVWIAPGAGLFSLFIILPIVRPYFRSLTGNTTEAPQQMQQWQIKLNMLRLSPKISVGGSLKKSYHCWTKAPIEISLCALLKSRGPEKAQRKEVAFFFFSIESFEWQKNYLSQFAPFMFQHKAGKRERRVAVIRGKNAMGSLNSCEVAALVPK